MRSQWRVLQYLILAAAVGLVACDDSGDTDGAGGSAMGGSPMGGTPTGGMPMGGNPMMDTISYSGVAVEWLGGAPGANFTVCQYGTENCTMTADDGSFTLAGLPTESEIVLGFVGADDARIAFPITTGTEDMTATRDHTIVARGTADIMLALAGEADGIDDTKAILTFFAGHAGLGRGLAGVEVTYDGPDTAKPISFIRPIAEDPGVTVAGADVTATTGAGNGFVPNIAAGDYTLTMTAADRTCTADFAWAGESANTFRTQLIEGYATFTFVNCKTDKTITFTGTVNEFGQGTPLEGADVCLNWGLNDDGSYINTNCNVTTAEGTVTNENIPGDTRILAELSKETYMTVLGTLESYTEDAAWLGALAPDIAVIAAAATVGVVVDETKGHVLVNVSNADGENLDGYTLSIVDSDATPVFATPQGAFDADATATNAAGSGGFLNLDPGTYTIQVEKAGVLCVPSAYSWSAGGYVAPIKANALTGIFVTCIDEPAPLFGEPSEPIEAAMCEDDAAEANCAEVCRYFTACAYDLCNGLQDLGEWETSITDATFEDACETTCSEMPEVVEMLCEFDTCNEGLSFGVDVNPAFAQICLDGWLNLLETAAQAAAAEDSVVTTVVGLAAGSETVSGLLANEEALTVFLPVDAAFEALAPETLAAVAEDNALRDTVLSYHVIPAALDAATVLGAIDQGLSYVDTLGGVLPLRLTDDGVVQIGGANVIGTDVFASNGVVHLIDSVILPPTPFAEPDPAVAAPMCVEGDIDASCTEACRQFIECSNAVCAGRQDISPWETEIGNNAMLAGCTAVCAGNPDVITERACNHTTCNETLMLVTASQEGFDEFCADGFDTIAETAGQAIEDGLPLATVGGLIGDTPAVGMALEGEGPFTLFLPIDAAFELLDADLLAMVAADEELRATVLQRHAVAAGYPAAAVVQALADGVDSIPTLGGPISLAQDDDGNILVGGATVIETDIFASNGVIHLIDGVILPE